MKPEWSMQPVPKQPREKKAAKQLRKRSRVNPVGEKRREEQKVYSLVRLEFLKDHSRCEAQLDGCGIYSSDVHHKVGRDSGRYLDAATFLAVCRRCHDAITDMAIDDAVRLGLSERRNGA